MAKLALILAAAAPLLADAPALADDSSAAVTAGGIVLVKNTPVRMQAEDLYISPKQVRVHFEFVNDTNKDAETLVAFPLPAIDMENTHEETIGPITDDPVNFVGFQVVVDGKAIPLQIEQRAYYRGNDVTTVLRTAGAPLNVIADRNREKLNALNENARKLLLSAGLVAEDDKTHVRPNWQLRTKFFWEQRFPAHRTVTIDHIYQPITGNGWFSDLADDPSQLKSAEQHLCFDSAAREQARAMIKAENDGYRRGAAYGALTTHETQYTLISANNWNGPIGRFHLTLDKLKPDSLLASCWSGKLKKTSPTRLESTLTNFRPTRDIDMVVVEWLFIKP